MAGDCFEVAAQLILGGTLGEDAVLVHGLPVGLGEENLGRRYWHAWLEYGDPPRVVDRSGGRNLDVPAEWYYGLGQIGSTWRYTRQEAVEEMNRAEHYGPWVPGWEELGL